MDPARTSTISLGGRISSGRASALRTTTSSTSRSRSFQPLTTWLLNRTSRHFSAVDVWLRSSTANRSSSSGSISIFVASSSADGQPRTMPMLSL